MTVQRMDHVGIIVEDLEPAIEFFEELGLVTSARWPASGDFVDSVIGLQDARSDCAMLKTPDGSAQIELSKFHSPRSERGPDYAPSNAPGIRHLCFQVDDVDDVVARLQRRGAELVGNIENYENIYRVCYVRGPEGIIVELGEKIG